jgi:hypothetical protein
MKKWIKGDSLKDITLMQRFAAGSIAGAVAQTVIFPMEVCMETCDKYEKVLLLLLLLMFALFSFSPQTVFSIRR